MTPGVSVHLLELFQELTGWQQCPSLASTQVEARCQQAGRQGPESFPEAGRGPGPCTSRVGSSRALLLWSDGSRRAAAWTASDSGSFAVGGVARAGRGLPPAVWVLGTWGGASPPKGDAVRPEGPPGVERTVLMRDAALRLGRLTHVV